MNMKNHSLNFVLAFQRKLNLKVILLK